MARGNRHRASAPPLGVAPVWWWALGGSTFVALLLRWMVSTGSASVLGPLLLAGLGAAGLLAAWRAWGVRRKPAPRPRGMNRLTWVEFEALVREHFKRRGYSTLVNHDPSPEGGVDLLLKRDGMRYLVQCKSWRADSVGIEPVRELRRAMAAQRVAGGFVVSMGRFNEEAREYAGRRFIQLVDGRALLGLRPDRAATRLMLEPVTNFRANVGTPRSGGPRSGG